MAHSDATAALALYRNFCTRSENVAEYLTIARKPEDILNVPIPSLTHVRLRPTLLFNAEAP